MGNGLLDEARKYIKDVNTIVDLFDVSFAYISEEVARFLGFSADQLIGKKIPKSIFDINASKQIIAEDMAKSKGTREFKIKNKNGDEVPVIAHFHTFEYDGGTYQAVKIIPKDK